MNSIKDGISAFHKPVFFDKKGHRSRVLTYLGLAVTVLATLLLAVFMISVLINPFLPQIRLKPIAVLPQQSDTKLQIPDPPVISKHDALLKQATDKVKAERNKRADYKAQQLLNKESLLAAAAPTPPPPTGQRPLAIGFYVNWDDSSYASLKQNIDQLDWLVPEWMRLNDSR